MMHGENRIGWFGAGVVLVLILCHSFAEEYEWYILYSAGLLLSLYLFRLPVWYAVNYKRIHSEWKTAEAVVTYTHRDSIFHGQPHTVTLCLSDDNEGVRHLTAHHVIRVRYHEDDVVKVLYNSEHPDDFLLIPEYRYRIAEGVVIGGVLMFLCIYGLFTI